MCFAVFIYVPYTSTNTQGKDEVGQMISKDWFNRLNMDFIGLFFGIFGLRFVYFGDREPAASADAEL